MPATEVLFFRDGDEKVPVLDWLLSLEKSNKRACQKCFTAIDLLRQLGHELRRPHADMLRDRIFELRTRVGNVNYRMLYGFVGKDVALLTCGLTKEKKVPPQEIDRALARIAQFKAAPELHTYRLAEEP